MNADGSMTGMPETHTPPGMADGSMVYPECEKSCPKGCDSPKDEHKVECLPCKECHEAADKVASLNGAVTGDVAGTMPAGMDNGAVTGDVAGTMPTGMDNGADTTATAYKPVENGPD